jgi:hypothetical protein
MLNNTTGGQEQALLSQNGVRVFKTKVTHSIKPFPTFEWQEYLYYRKEYAFLSV